MPPKDPAEKRVRIGLTLAPDVARILADHGRTEHVWAVGTGVKPTRTEIIEEAVREWHARRFIHTNGSSGSRTHEPTDADGLSARLEAQRWAKTGSGCDGPLAFIEPTETQGGYYECTKCPWVGRTDPVLHTIPIYNPDPEQQVKADRGKNRSTKQKAIARAGRKAELVEGVKAALPRVDMSSLIEGAMSRSLERDRQQGKCPHPAGSRTAGKDWRCTSCGYQH